MILFPGIIGRKAAEDLLVNRNNGDFIIRVSDRIFGYVLSFK